MLHLKRLKFAKLLIVWQNWEHSPRSKLRTHSKGFWVLLWMVRNLKFYPSSHCYTQTRSNQPDQFLPFFVAVDIAGTGGRQNRAQPSPSRWPRSRHYFLSLSLSLSLSFCSPLSSLSFRLMHGSANVCDRWLVHQCVATTPPPAPLPLLAVVGVMGSQRPPHPFCSFYFFREKGGLDPLLFLFLLFSFFVVLVG